MKLQKKTCKMNPREGTHKGSANSDADEVNTVRSSDGKCNYRGIWPWEWFGHGIVVDGGGTVNHAQLPACFFLLHCWSLVLDSILHYARTSLVLVSLCKHWCSPTARHTHWTGVPAWGVAEGTVCTAMGCLLQLTFGRYSWYSPSNGWYLLSPLTT